MSKREEYEKKAEELVMPLLEENHFELVDVEYVKEGANRYLRYYIDKEGGITIDDCELVSRAVSDKLDEQDFIEEAYILEVSSPGLGRSLKKPRDFERSIGKAVEITLYKAMDGQKMFEGTLTGWDDKQVVITVNEKELVFEKNGIAQVRLAFDF